MVSSHVYILRGSRGTEESSAELETRRPFLLAERAPETFQQPDARLEPRSLGVILPIKIVFWDGAGGVQEGIQAVRVALPRKLLPQRRQGACSQIDGAG